VNVTGVEQTRNMDRETRIEELRMGESPSANRLGLRNDRNFSSSSFEDRTVDRIFENLNSPERYQAVQVHCPTTLTESDRCEQKCNFVASRPSTICNAVAGFLIRALKNQRERAPTLTLIATSEHFVGHRPYRYVQR